MGRGGAVLVTGAGGFIGGRIVEVLHAVQPRPVRASIRRWSSAVRVGRLPVEIVLCDVTDRDQVKGAMEGVDMVVHCAYGGEHVNVAGTRNVLEAARDVGARRVVHLSTMEVYGNVDGEVREDAPLRKSGWEYRDSKIEAELLCHEEMERGLPVTILRPTIVHGPFSRNWTIGFAERLMAGGTFPSREDAQGVCNLLYVDDLVEAVRSALDREEAVGEAFNVNGEEWVTWWQYLCALNEALGLPSLDGGGRLARRLRSLLMTPVRATARFALDRFETPIMALYQNSNLAQRVMKRAEASIRQTPSTGEYDLFRRRGSFPVTKAREKLGYRARFSMAEGVALSARWLRHHGFVDGVPQVEPVPARNAEQATPRYGEPATRLR